MIGLFLFLSQISFATPFLDGTYVHSCYTVGDDTLASQVKIQNQDWTITHTAYEDDKCQKPYLMYETAPHIKTP